MEKRAVKEITLCNMHTVKLMDTVYLSCIQSLSCQQAGFLSLPKNKQFPAPLNQICSSGLGCRYHFHKVKQIKKCFFSSKNSMLGYNVTSRRISYETSGARTSTLCCVRTSCRFMPPCLLAATQLNSYKGRGNIC